MTQQTYLILIRDGKLALSAGRALEEQLAADGHPAIALVPSRRGTDFSGPGGTDQRFLHQASLWGGTTPQVVALYEDGLLDMLKTLGLAAYVGVPADHHWRVIHFDDTASAGAMLLPVATGRDLVDAVAARVPWHQYATPEPVTAAARRTAGVHRRPVWAGRGTSSARKPAILPTSPLARRLAIAGVAVPLLTVGLPAAAAVATETAPVAGGPSLPVVLVGTTPSTGRGGAANVGQGEAGVQAAIPQLEAQGYQILGTQIKFKTQAGDITADIVARNPQGILTIIEVKNGPGAKLTYNQAQVYNWLKQYENGMNLGATPIGPKAQSAGLKPGQAVTVMVETFQFPVAVPAPPARGPSETGSISGDDAPGTGRPGGASSVPEGGSAPSGTGNASGSRPAGGSGAPAAKGAAPAEGPVRAAPARPSGGGGGGFVPGGGPKNPLGGGNCLNPSLGICSMLFMQNTPPSGSPVNLTQNAPAQTSSARTPPGQGSPPPQNPPGQGSPPPQNPPADQSPIDNGPGGGNGTPNVGQGAPGTQSGQTQAPPADQSPIDNGSGGGNGTPNVGQGAPGTQSGPTPEQSQPSGNQPQPQGPEPGEGPASVVSDAGQPSTEQLSGTTVVAPPADDTTAPVVPAAFTPTPVAGIPNSPLGGAIPTVPSGDSPFGSSSGAGAGTSTVVASLDSGGGGAVPAVPSGGSPFGSSTGAGAGTSTVVASLDSGGGGTFGGGTFGGGGSG